jgi:hypothetical protein
MRNLVVTERADAMTPEPSIRGRPQMFGEIHTFAGPYLGPRNAQESIFFA